MHMPLDSGCISFWCAIYISKVVTFIMLTIDISKTVRDKKSVKLLKSCTYWGDTLEPNILRKIYLKTKNCDFLYSLVS